MGKSGGKQIRKETIQTKATIVLARREVIMLRYLTGRVTATYLSTLMAHRFRMEAVEIQTSVTSQPRHQISPNIQTSKIFSCPTRVGFRFELNKTYKSGIRIQTASLRVSLRNELVWAEFISESRKSRAGDSCTSGLVAIQSN